MSRIGLNAVPERVASIAIVPRRPLAVYDLGEPELSRAGRITRWLQRPECIARVPEG